MPKPSQKCKNFEVFQRLNYLFQIKNVMINHPKISTHYGNLITNIAKKSVLKIDPGLKRQLCKKCKGVLSPGKNVNVKIIRKNKKPVVIYKCEQCGFDKKYPIQSDKKVWTETKESIIDVIEGEKQNAENIEKKKNLKHKL